MTLRNYNCLLFIIILPVMKCAPDAEVKKENAKRYLARPNVGKAESSRPVLFNLFCYGAPLKMFRRTHAPYLLKRPPCPHLIAPMSVSTRV